MAYRYSVSYTLATPGNRIPREIFLTDEVNGWLDHLAMVAEDSYQQVVYAIEVLASAARTLVGHLSTRITGSAVHNLKELRLSADFRGKLRCSPR
jgi:hypothetical protein